MPISVLVQLQDLCRSMAKILVDSSVPLLVSICFSLPECAVLECENIENGNETVILEKKMIDAHGS